MSLAHLLIAWALLPAALPASGEGPESARRHLLERVQPPLAVDLSGPGSRDAFLEVLDTDLFLHAEIGLLDLYVMQADGLAKPATARKLLTEAQDGLRPLEATLSRHFEGLGGVIAGRRLPIVLCRSEAAAGQTAFAELIALLDWAEDDYSGWKPSGNPVWSDGAPQQLTVRTWEVQLFNLSHKDAQIDGFLEHGLGYYTLAHIVARLLRQGSWGMVPPWLAQGLIDELDIETYGEAWVGGDWWERQTPGWSRPGWSGFVPQGASPPPPVTGPPADLAVTVTQTGDSWQHRANSPKRHWTELAADRKSEAPASFRFMAEHESFLPRDRAYARCALHLVVDLFKPARRPSLVRLLDRMPYTSPAGISDADPLTAIVNRALGGVPEVDRLQALPLGELLDELGRPEVAARIRELGGGPALALADHRQQIQWLYEIPIEELDWPPRNELFALFLEAEYYQQLREWEYLGAALDRAMAATFAQSPQYPKLQRQRDRLADGFWQAVAEDG